MAAHNSIHLGEYCPVYICNSLDDILTKL